LCSYRSGKAVYTWPTGIKEEFNYDKNGQRNGPAKLTKPDGSVEHRQYKNGVKEVSLSLTHFKKCFHKLFINDFF